MITRYKRIIELSPWEFLVCKHCSCLCDDCLKIMQIEKRNLIWSPKCFFCCGNGMEPIPITELL